MNNKVMKNIEAAKILNLSDLVSCQEGQVVSKTLVQNEKVSITLFAFDKGEEISSHASHGDALVSVLSGMAEITIDGEKYSVNEGNSILMPADVSHAVYAPEKMKFMLTVTF